MPILPFLLSKIQKTWNGEFIEEPKNRDRKKLAIGKAILPVAFLK